MINTSSNSGKGNPALNEWQHRLPSIADEIAGNLYKFYAMRQTIYKYAIRQGAFHMLHGNKEEGSNEIDRSGLAREIMSLLAGFITGGITDLTLIEAIRNRDGSRISILLKEKCRSALQDGARNPRFRAIRNIVSNAASEGVLNYRPARGLYGGTGGNWACYAFSDDEELAIIGSDQNLQDYQNWPIPPFIEAAHSKGGVSQLTQKKLVLETARFFWEETTLRHGPGMVLLIDLKTYMEKRLPPWIMTAYLPDPLKNLTTHDSPWGPDNDEGESDQLFGGNTPSTAALWPAGQDELEPEHAVLRETAINLAKNWLISLKDKDAVIFCLKYHCEDTLKEITRKMGLPTEQHVDYHYKSSIKKLIAYCTRHEGLSPPDEDPTLAKLFAEMLREVCTKQILKGGCE